MMESVGRAETRSWVARVAGLAAVAGVLAAAPAGAQVAPTDSAVVHLVRPGDTLWDLAELYLQDPFRWPEIARLNPDIVEDPHWIFPAERIRIRIPIGPPPGPVAVAGVPAGPAGPPPRTVFFPAPAGPAARQGEVRFDAGATASAVLPGDFYGAGLLVPEAAVSPVGRLAAPLAPTVVPLELPAQIAVYDRVYLTLAAPGAVRMGDRLHLLRPDREVRPYGRLFVATGLARVVALDGEVATVEIEQMFDAVDVGDVAVPVPAFAARPGVEATPAAGGLEGRLLAFLEPQALHAVEDVAFLDVGADAGVVEGDEFLAVLPPEREEWGVRPEIVVARLRVIRAEARTSAVRVVELEHPALEPGLPVRLSGKMP